ncbi:MAG: aminotransferase class I/II-fold pyridoxal phosphate-dependent enzyme [Candidatus Cryptobacteroides sp.]
MKGNLLSDIRDTISALEEDGNLRNLPSVRHCGRYVEDGACMMLNLSSNDYLALSSDETFNSRFLHYLETCPQPFTSSSSRLLTGNYEIYEMVEQKLASLYGTEAALVAGCGYLLNAGILPAVCRHDYVILADKLVHASIIDGIRLSSAETVRFRHQDFAQLENLMCKYSDRQKVIVTESIFSMDGDVTDLRELVRLKNLYPGTVLYVDEAHAVGVRGETGLGVAQEQGCIADIDFLCGTFGKALASAGAFVVCTRQMKEYLVNKMRTVIFSTALPPVNMLRTLFVLENLAEMGRRRENLSLVSALLRDAVREMGLDCPSESHIVPLMAGDSKRAVELARKMRDAGFYLLPVRPPTVPEGTSRLRVSLTADVTADEIGRLIETVKTLYRFCAVDRNLSNL